MTHDFSPGKGKRRTRLGLAAAAACAATAFALPAAGHAAVTTLGSDLSKPADLVDAHGADSAFWNVFLGSQGQAMPAGGQITFIRVKGTVLDDPDKPQRPDPQFHFQVLRPQGGGRVRVMLSSAPFRLPIAYPQSARGAPARGDQQQISGYKPVNLCVNQGDYVDFNDIGGFEWRWGRYSGMAVQVFSRTPDSTTNFYSKNNGTNIGSEWSPQETKQGEELLMQMKLSTGPDATDICPGGFKQHIFKGLSLRRESVTVSAKKRVLKMHADCPYPNYGGCKGVLVVKATVAGQPITVAGSSFNVKPAYSTSLELKLSTKVLKQIKKAGGVTAKITAEAHDDPAHDRRANPGVPVQHKTTTGAIKVRVG